MGRGLCLWLTPLMALPIWMTSIVSCARVVGHLLHFLVALIQYQTRGSNPDRRSVEHRDTNRDACLPQARACSPSRSSSYIHSQVSLEININSKCLLSEGWVVEVVGIAVVCGELVQEVQSERAADTPL